MSGTGNQLAASPWFWIRCTVCGERGERIDRQIGFVEYRTLVCGCGKTTERRVANVVDGALVHSWEACEEPDRSRVPSRRALMRLYCDSENPDRVDVLGDFVLWRDREGNVVQCHKSEVKRQGVRL